MSARDTYVGDGLPEGTILLADKAQVVNQAGEIPKAARGRVSGRAPAAVGISLFHTVGDRERALDQIATGFTSLQNEVMRAAGYSADPYRPASGPIWDWWQVAGAPTIAEWQTFHANQTSSWGQRFAASWEVYEAWQKRLEALRAAAAQHVQLVSPPPAPLPTTLPGAVLDAAGGAAKAVGGALHAALWVGLGLGGLWVGTKIYGAARGGK